MEVVFNHRQAPRHLALILSQAPTQLDAKASSPACTAAFDVANLGSSQLRTTAIGPHRPKGLNNNKHSQHLPLVKHERLPTQPPVSDMSLAKLPTEADATIIDFLDHGALHAVCLTSKYYRDLAEPRLYGDVRFTVKDALKVKMLLFTLLKRPELAKYIKRIMISPELTEGTSQDMPELLSFGQSEQRRRLQEKRKQALYEECWGVLPIIQQKVETSWPKLPQRSKLSWLEGVVSEGQPSLSACLALIITFAENAEYLDYQLSHDSPILYTVLSYYRPPDATDSTSGHPLAKLKDIHLRGIQMLRDAGVMRYWVPLPASAEVLSITEHSIDHFEYPLPRPEGYVPQVQYIGPLAHHPLNTSSRICAYLTYTKSQ